MSHPYIHAVSSAKIFGGVAEDYLHLHNWFDETKSWCADWRHRAIRHHTEGINECIEVFGDHLINSEGDEISILEIGQQHVVEDVGFLVSARDWMEHFDSESWEEFKRKKTEDRHTLHREMKDKLPSALMKLLKENA